MHKLQIHPQYKHFETFLLNIQDIFKEGKSSIHKARNELKIIEHNGLKLVVKSFKIPNFINKVAYSYLRDSKAKKSYEYSLILKDFTPQPIGYVEFFENNLIVDSYFVSEAYEYDFTIREPLLDTNFSDREEVFKTFARFSFELHENNIFHDDYSPGNILIKKEATQYIFKIVDVNRMDFEPLNEIERAKNFSKLWASDEALTIIATEYKKHYKCSDTFVAKVLHYSLQNKKIKNFKKRLKGKEIDW